MSCGMDTKFERSVVDAKEEFDRYLLQRFPPDENEELMEFFMLSMVKRARAKDRG